MTRHCGLHGADREIAPDMRLDYHAHTPHKDFTCRCNIRSNPVCVPQMSVRDGYRVDELTNLEMQRAAAKRFGTDLAVSIPMKPRSPESRCF
jgi:hypothetical protein